MRTDKLMRRLADLGSSPEELERVARDIGFALARGQREPLAEVARELAARAPHSSRQDAEKSYWAGFAAALGTVVAAYQAAHEQSDARQAALNAASSDSAQAVIAILATHPATGAELAASLGITPGATSKILASLRGAGLVRLSGSQTYPKRGARKPHVLTPLGGWVADQLAARTGKAKQRSSRAGER